MRSQRVARRYAQALMSTAEELRLLDAIAADVETIGTTVRSSRELRLFLNSPVVSIPRKKTALHELFGNRISPATLSFLDLLVRKQRETLLPEILEQFAALRDEQKGIVDAHVATAVELTPQQLRALQIELERQTGKHVRLNVTADSSIRGGLVIRIGDTVLDASLTHQLERLREHFARGASLPH
ncbi:MAG TPA: ATP synthase F1 subunit delta [Bacteroidota bacterium]|nr:ATP synthase F1 subunit delta [Bacteroidota bacterium]